MSGTLTLHSRFNRIMAVVCVVLAGILVYVGTQSAPPLLWSLPAAGLLVFWAWEALWAPGLTIDDAGVRIRNVTHTVDLPWEALIHVDTRFALTLRTPDAAYTAWSAPAPSALTAARVGRRADNRELRVAGAAPRPGDLAGTDSGDAALLIREEWQARVEAGLIEAGAADRYRATRRVHAGVLAGFAALVAATVWGFLYN